MPDSTPNALPGSSQFAPQARFVDLQSGTVLGTGMAGSAPADRLDSDMLSVQVTQVATGVSQLSATFNNQRFVNGSPAFPPWKYNNLDTLRFGKTVRVDLRYGADPWVPMIVARVTDVKFAFPNSGGAKITLKGEDLLSVLKCKDERDKRYRNDFEDDIVADVLQRSGARLAAGSALAHLPRFDEGLRSVTHQKSQTYLKFIQSLAERLDYEVFVAFSDNENPDSEIAFHFEATRSLLLGDVFSLRWGRDILEFNPTFKVWEQFTSAVARGRHPRNRQRIEETAAARAIEADLHQEEGNAAPLNAIAARERFFEGHDCGNVEPVDVANLDSGRARRKAEAVLRKRAREFLTVEGKTIGSPALRPGMHMSIAGMSAPFDGLYYVTKTVHTLDNSGYRTGFSLRRPGMLPPEGYLTGGQTPSPQTPNPAPPTEANT